MDYLRRPLSASKLVAEPGSSLFVGDPDFCLSVIRGLLGFMAGISVLEAMLSDSSPIMSI